jgi:hypothetical protein
MLILFKQLITLFEFIPIIPAGVKAIYPPAPIPNRFAETRKRD